NQNTQTEIVETIESPSYGNSQPNWDKIFQILGWLSLILSVVYFIAVLGQFKDFSYDNTGLYGKWGEFILFILYGAIILGIPGFFKKRSRMLSIRSLSLLILSFALLVIWNIRWLAMWW
ncbi:MAG: hypothetical protein HOL56_05190, partial [Flavobacteriales bacterium]|nr:hypothetical protein [Flavobacteriales bacterium]MBT7620599.1 hypothetical protein [Flavobacteriales bacterium]